MSWMSAMFGGGGGFSGRHNHGSFYDDDRIDRSSFNETVNFRFVSLIYHHC